MDLIIYVTLKCYKDGFNNSICDEWLKLNEINALWKLDSNESEGKFLNTFISLRKKITLNQSFI